jgi:hypothetical protein
MTSEPKMSIQSNTLEIRSFNIPEVAQRHAKSLGTSSISCKFEEVDDHDQDYGPAKAVNAENSHTSGKEHRQGLDLQTGLHKLNQPAGEYLTNDNRSVVAIDDSNEMGI